MTSPPRETVALAGASPRVLAIPKPSTRQLVIAATMYSLGVYTKRKLSVSRAASAIVIGYILLSALTFFFKQYAFSRMVVLISGCVNFMVLTGWRLAAKTRTVI